MLCKTTTPDPVFNTFGAIYPDEADLRWVKLVRGSKGDLIGLLAEPGEERGKVCLISDLPDEAVEGQFAVVDVTPTRSGRAYHASVAWALACRSTNGFTSGSDGERCLFLVGTLAAAEAALAHLLADRASKAEQDARRCDAAEAERQAAKAAFDAELAALPPAEAELVRLMKSHDWWYSYSDDGRVWQRGNDHWASICAAVHNLPQAAASRIWTRFAPEDFRYQMPI